MRLIVVGKTSFPFVEEGVQTYLKRLQRMTKFDLIEIPFKAGKGWSENQVKVEEGRKIINSVGTDRLILFDENGKENTSRQFAEFIQKAQVSSWNLTFVIGGPYGFSEEVYGRAHGKISLSKMTFSHQLVRIMAMEQLYRAHSIIKGLPYHHD